MPKKKNLLESIGIFLFFSVLVTLFDFNSQDFSYDRIWVFHMLQKIANGDLIYSEINVLVGPIFYIFGGMIFKIFGSNFIVYDCLGGITYGAIAVLAYSICKLINKDDDKILNLLMIVVLYYFSKVMYLPNYNSFALFFIMCAMYTELKMVYKEKHLVSNLLIGAFLALAFFSKQTIGGMAIIATGLISIVYGISVEKKFPIKEILQKATGFFVIFIPIIILMAISGNLIDYIDLCFGSILEFASNNTSISNMNIYLSFSLAFLLVGLTLFKMRKTDKELLIIPIYAIAVIFFAIPLGNAYHLHLATFFTWFILLKIINIFKESDNETILKVLITIPFIAFVVSLYTLDAKTIKTMTNEEIVELITGFSIYTNGIDIIIMVVFVLGVINKNQDFIKTSLAVCMIVTICFFTYNYIANLEDKITPDGLEIYANHGFENEKLNEIKDITQYILEKEKEGYTVKGVSWDASEYMAPLNRNNGKYDLLMNGNLGYNGISKTLEEMKKWENTIILKNQEPFWQEPAEIMDYIEENCSKVDEIYGIDVFYQE